MRTSHAIAFLLGVSATLLAVLVFRPLQVIEAQAASSGGGFVAVSNGGNPGGRDILWLVDTKDRRLLVYELAEQDHLYLRTARNIEYDFLLDQWPAANRHTPSVEQVFKATEEKRKRQQPPPGGSPPEKPK
jgi:hypothetical protein